MSRGERGKVQTAIE